jgi:hypothetical protein
MTLLLEEHCYGAHLKTACVFTLVLVALSATPEHTN